MIQLYSMKVILMEELVSLFGNFGFPIGLVIYLLFRFEMKLAQLSEVIGELSHLIRSTNIQKRNE